MVSGKYGWTLLAGLLICLSVCLRASDGVSSSSGCQDKVSTFLARPGKMTLAALSGPTSATCWGVVGSSNSKLNQLNHWVEQGNPWAAQYSAKHLKQLDGGNLEDTLIALGQFSEHDMEQFLLFANQKLLSKTEFSDALTMLPLALSDDPAGQLAVLSARRSKVTRVARKALSEQKKQALTAIDRFASEIRKHQGSSR